jgi:hypothetical protein
LRKDAVINKSNKPESMHIAFFIYKMSNYGAPRRTLTLIQKLVSKGHRVDLVIVKKEPTLFGEIPTPVR